MKRIFTLGCLLSCLTYQTTIAHHNGNRYFPFLERPEMYTARKKSSATPALFFTTASTAFKRGGNSGGIPELWGNYDLKDVIASLHTIKPTENPATAVGIPPTWLETDGTTKSMKFKIDGTIKSIGVILNYEHKIGWENFYVGAWLPLMRVTTTEEFGFNTQDFNNTIKASINHNQELLIDQLQRTTHQKIGLTGNDSDNGGLGDLDLHIRWNYFIDHQFLMRSINTSVQGGLIAPTGRLSDINRPSSVSFMGNGHWGMYVDVVPEFELKQDWKIGLMLGALYQFKNTRTMRIPISKEPAIFSSLIGRIEIDPGITAKIAPYFTLENLTDGLHFRFQYTYLRHAIDKTNDARSDRTIACYLNSTADKAQKENLSKWRYHYASFNVIYDSKQALQNWFLEPTLYATYDMPISGNGVSNTHHVTIGAQLHF